jgi:hypothetical protein
MTKLRNVGLALVMTLSTALVGLAILLRDGKEVSV